MNTLIIHSLVQCRRTQRLGTTYQEQSHTVTETVFCTFQGTLLLFYTYTLPKPSKLQMKLLTKKYQQFGFKLFGFATKVRERNIILSFISCLIDGFLRNPLSKKYLLKNSNSLCKKRLLEQTA